jgi:hypothetical protein
MNRLIVQMGALPLDTDILHTNRHALVGLGMALQAMFGAGNAGPYTEGLPCTPGTGMTVNIGPGAVYVQAAIDATAYGSLAANTTDQIIQQGNLFGQNALACPAPGTTGQSINYLIEVQFQQVDSQPTALLYYNSANPLQPLLGAATNSQRSGVCALRSKAGAAAATGTQTTPAADAGWTGLYVVTVANGATSIITGNISALAGAPVLAGLLNSHHGGGAGQAPKINLTTEVQGILPASNLPIGMTIWCGTTTGTANAQIVATPSSILTFPAGSGIAFEIGAGLTNTGAVNFTVGSFGTFPVRKDGPTGPIALAGGEMVAGADMTMRLNAAGTALQLTATEMGTAALANASSNTGTVVAASGAFGIGHLLVAADVAGTAQDGGPPGVAPGATPLNYTANGQTIGPGVYNIDSTSASFGLNLVSVPAYGANFSVFDFTGTWAMHPVLLTALGGLQFNVFGILSPTLNLNTTGEFLEITFDGTYWRLG